MISIRRGVSQGKSGSGGVRGLLFITDIHWYNVLACLGLTTNNKVDLTVVILDLKLSIPKAVAFIQIFWDLLLVIELPNAKIPPNNIFLKPLYEEICRMLATFDEVSFHHTYMK